jgi:hypothetical protein
MEVQKLTSISILAVSAALEVGAKFGLIMVVDGRPAAQFLLCVGEGALG